MTNPDENALESGLEKVEGVPESTKQGDSITETELDTVVEDVFQYLGTVFVKHFGSAMLEAGQYLINQFYDGDYKAAEKKEFSKNKSLNLLFQKIQADNSGNVPKKTWLYNSIDLAIDNNKYLNVSAYGKLGHSHKVKLTNTGVLPEKIKLKLIKETEKKGYSVKDLQDRITDEKRKLSGNFISLLEPIEAIKLQAFDTNKLKFLKVQTENRVKGIQEKMDLYKANLDELNKVLEEREGISEDVEAYAKLPVYNQEL